LKHLRRWDVDSGLGTHVFLRRWQILSTDVVVVVDSIGDFTEGVSVKVFGFDGMNIPCISCIADEIYLEYGKFLIFFRGAPSHHRFF
jgi:hypothetical protein